MKTIIISFISVLITLSVSSQTATDKKAKAILDEVSQKTKLYKTISIDFTYTMLNKANNINQSKKGSVIIKGEKFLARCLCHELDHLDGILYIDIMEKSFNEVKGLPEPQEDTYYIVSALVAGAAKNRVDLLIPNDTVRDEQGRIVGCRSLAKI